MTGNPTAVDRLLADVRVLMDGCSRGQSAACVFIIATDADLRDQEQGMLNAFERMKGFLPNEYRVLFSLEIWDAVRLLSKERELGIKISV